MGNESFLRDLVFNNHTSQKFTVSSSFTASKMRAQLFSQMLKRIEEFPKKAFTYFRGFFFGHIISLCTNYHNLYQQPLSWTHMKSITSETRFKRNLCMVEMA